MSQSLSKIYTHLVFSTKGRTDTLPKQHLTEIHAYVAEILNQHHSPAICVGGTSNHIHILVILNKTMSVSDTVRVEKANSSKWINKKNGKNYLFCWQDGYGAFSISQNHVDAVKHYIETQEEHHAKIDFKDEFRRLCGIYGVGLDERYAWD